MAVLISEGYIQGTKLVEFTAIKPYAFAQSIKNEVALSNRERCFSGHDSRRGLGPSGDKSKTHLWEICRIYLIWVLFGGTLLRC